MPAIRVRSPGRANLIGEHTDYNLGWVLPMAIDRALDLAVRPRRDRRVELHSDDLGSSVAFHLDEVGRTASPVAGWGTYVTAVVRALQDAGLVLTGLEGTLRSDLPIGAGLSSSAALELGVARALAAVAGLDWDPVAMAELCHRAEEEGVGVRCGIMDHLICAVGRDGHAMLVDCRSLERTAVPVPDELRVVIMDTGTRRALAGSAYNERRAECEAAARALGRPTLRGVSEDELPGLDPVVASRARHVVTENRRTLEMADALRSGDRARMTGLLEASHRSLRDDYEVSSPALDAMVECAREGPGYAGARMTGAGFGGCAVALVEREGADDFVTAVSSAYARRTGIAPALYVCRPSDGVGVATSG